jgi:coproporphyrinogen III oxidase-like Fe-S oxidoreductase
MDEAEDATSRRWARASATCRAYHLTLEPNTRFAAHPPQLPDDDLAADMQDAVEARLARSRLRALRNLGLCAPGQQCRHNLNYWTFGDYLGIGAGAHGKLSNHERIWRETRQRHPRAYLDAAAHGEFCTSQTTIDVHDLPGEFMMNALRLNEGFPAVVIISRQFRDIVNWRTFWPELYS